MKTIRDVIDYFGSRAALAKALGVSPPAVTIWCSLGRLPGERAIQIERLTAGVIRAIDLPTTRGAYDAAVEK